MKLIMIMAILVMQGPVVTCDSIGAGGGGGGSNPVGYHYPNGPGDYYNYGPGADVSDLEVIFIKGKVIEDSTWRGIYDAEVCFTAGEEVLCDYSGPGFSIKLSSAQVKAADGKPSLLKVTHPKYMPDSVYIDFQSETVKHNFRLRQKLKTDSSSS